MHEALMRAQRIALLGELLSTFMDVRDRANFIERLRVGDAITATTADLLMEAYVWEPAK